MAEKIKSIMLEYEKSAFHIDIVKHKSGLKYVSIQQVYITDSEQPERQTLKINPSILSDIIEILSSYHKEISLTTNPNKNFFSEERKSNIKKRYLKGVEIKDLALQFDCSTDIIEQILRNSQYEIVSNTLSKQKRNK